MARRRGKDHALRLIATAALLVLAAGMPARAQSGDPALAAPGSAPAPAVSFTQRGVPAEATAENAVIARERAHAAGRRIAWERMAGALGVTRSLSDGQIEAMVTSIVIEEERITPTRYAGRITVNFNPGRVRAMGGGAVAGGGDTRPPGDPGPGDPGLRPPPPLPATAAINAVARYGSQREWLEIRRRLTGGGSVAGVQVLAIAIDRAQIRLSLRAAPNIAAEELARAGIMLAPPVGGPGDAWRVGLAGRS